MKNYILITAIFREHQFIGDLFKMAFDCRCNIEAANTKIHQNMTAATLYLSGTWDAIAKAENAVENLKNKHQVKIMQHRLEEKPYNSDLIPYQVNVSTHDKPGVIESILHFFIDHQITVHALTSDTYLTNLTHAKMANLNMTILVPVVNDLSQLRENFLVFCDGLNVDAVILPEKE